ncbi:hypothetical protein F5X68DRAFT_201710 [Plectosphaerella plurivora]|uniref:WW domain-containing protein n=1 Tax=Plectosphaerella plurivora TaxID=936078 RepID=A0A9P8VHN4_9PEZI|nr:hypothetical protein F5X68DRAFT_201710 [Plectosphaerella plurivora]
MSGLPLGWESDYDGHRWFYRFKPTGQTQFQFPKEGDEFPDFIDDLAPAPALAPEERLESQQQVKRKTTTSTSGDDVNSSGVNSSRMRATGGPLGAGLGFGGPGGGLDDDDDDGGTFYYQPESFMFLGPGAYSNVSPMAEEDDRVDAGTNDAPRGRTPNRAVSADRASRVSPIQSEATTPLALKSVLATTAPVENKHADGQSSEAAGSAATPTPTETTEQSVSPPAIQLDSREIAHELPASTYYSPVGFIAEMPTEDTARARIETHPDPVEIGDSSVLAPIEIRTAALQAGVAELADHTSPVEPKSLVLPQPSDELQQTSMPEHLLHQATFGTQARPTTVSPPSSDPNLSKALSTPASELANEEVSRTPQEAPLPAPARNPAPQFTITRKPTNAGAKPSPYNAYAPGASSAQPSGTAVKAEPERGTQPGEAPQTSNRDKRASLLSREGSLMLGSSSSSNIVASQVPSVLQPPQGPAEQPPPQPVEQAYPVYAAAEPSLASTTQSPAGVSNGTPAPASGQHDEAPSGPLSHVPSVLKPGPRRTAPIVPQPTSQQPRDDHIAFQQGQFPGHIVSDRAAGARTAPPTQRAPPFPVGQPPQSMAPGFIQQQRLVPRPGVQRVQSEPIDPPYPVTPRQYPVLPAGRGQPPPLQTPPAPDQGRARQQSFASSDVSSLGPSSSTQTLSSMQTPSPMEDGRPRIPSNASGFFMSMDISSPSSASDVHSQAQSPVPQPGRRRDSGGRSSSFSGPIQSQPAPPAIPDKVPLPQEPAVRSNSMPQQQTQQPPRPPPKDVVDTSDSGQFRQSPASTDVARQQQAWGQPSQQSQNGMAPRQMQQQPDQQGAVRQGEESQARPQRPSVVPPPQQGHRLSMSTPMSPGHHLHAIQESPESEHSYRVPRPGVRAGQPQQQPQAHQQPQQQRQQHPQQQAGQNSAQPNPMAFSGSPGVHQPPVAPAHPAAPYPGGPPQPGVTFLQQQWQQGSQNPAQLHQRTMSSPIYMQPGMTPDPRRDEKKDKGSWLSRQLKKTSNNKPSVLHKQPPSSIQQGYSVPQFQPQQPAYVMQQQQPPHPQQQQQQQYQFPPRQQGAPQQQHHISPQQQQQQQQQQWSTYQNQPDQRRTGQQAGVSPNGSPMKLSGGVSPASQASPVTQPQRASLDGHQPTISPLSNNPRAGNPPPQQQAQPNHLPSAAQGPAPPPADLNRNVSNASTYAASISTADISEAEAQPMLKGHLVSVRRPPGASAPNQQAQQWSSNQPQVQGQSWPAAHRNPNQGPGTPVDQSYVVPPLFSSTKQAAPGGEASSGRGYARDSVVSTVSYRNPRASVVSAMSAEDVTPPPGSKWQRPAPDYSGDSWGEDEYGRQ